MTVISMYRVPERNMVVVGADTMRSMPGGVALTLPPGAGKIHAVGNGLILAHMGDGGLRNLTSQVDFGSLALDRAVGLEKALLRTIIPEMIKLAKELNLTSAGEKLERPLFDGMVVVAWGPELCLINGNLSVTPIGGEQLIWAIGHGGLLALGALELAVFAQLEPRQAVEKALEAAGKYDQHCGPPYEILESSYG